MHCLFQKTTFKKTMIVAATIFSCLLLGQHTLAQGNNNQQMAFEGSLTNSFGEPIDLSYPKVLKFYISSSTGCYLYGESSNTSGDSQGNILHRFGSGTPLAGSPNTSFSQNLFFGIVSGTTNFAGNSCTVTASDTRVAQVEYYDATLNTNITATIKLGTVPYAQNATMLSGKSASDFVPVTADTNTVFNTGASGQILTKSATGLAWIYPTLNAAQITTALGYTPSSGTSNVTSASVTSALGYTPANSATSISSANNLSDLTSPSIARNNLGLGFLATINYIDLGTALASGTLPMARLSDVGVGVTSGTPYSKVTVDSKGRVVSGAQFNSADVITALGYVPSSATVGITSLNGSSSLAQTFANGTTGTAPLFTTTASVHTLNIPFASVSTVTAGLISYLDYSNFTNKISSSSASIAQALGYMPASATSWLQNGSNTFTNSNVGIGTISPGYALDVSGTTRSVGPLIVGALGNSGQINLARFSDNAITYNISIGPSNEVRQLNPQGSGFFSWHTNYGSFTGERMRIDNTGNVGIGFAAPSAKLHLASGTSTLASLKLTSGTLLASPASGSIEYDGFDFYFTDGTNTRRSLASYSGNGASYTSLISNLSGPITLSPVGSVIVSSTTGSISPNTGALIVSGGVGVAGNIFAAGTINTSANIQGASITALNGVSTTVITGAPYLALNPYGGNVAIGTTSSSARLTVSGTGATAATASLHIINGASQSLMYVRNDGNVGIGTTIPSQTLDVSGGARANFFIPGSGGNNSFPAFRNMTGSAGLFFPTSNSIAFSTNFSEVMRIDGLGNVGIGVTSISANLHLAPGTNSIPSFKFTSGTLLTAPASGSIEYDGFNFYFTNGNNNRRRIAGGTASGTIDNVNRVSFASSFLTLEGSATASMPAVVIDNIGAGQVALHVNKDMVVSGSIKIAGEGPDIATSCLPEDEGKQRYNKTFKTMEYCDGSYWQGVQGVTNCPTGSGSVAFTLIGTPGTADAFCITKYDQPTNKYPDAVNHCANTAKSYNGSASRLCSESELNMACVAYTALAANAESKLPGFGSSTNDYWIPSADPAYALDYSVATNDQCLLGNTATTSTSRNTGSSNYSRCCYQ